jgi:predicted dehydrogenase
MSDQIRFAVVGSGHIGKRHAAMIQQNPESELVAMADVNPALAEDIGSTFGVPFFSSIEELNASGL